MSNEQYGSLNTADRNKVDPLLLQGPTVWGICAARQLDSRSLLVPCLFAQTRLEDLVSSCDQRYDDPTTLPDARQPQCLGPKRKPACCFWT